MSSVFVVAATVALSLAGQPVPMPDGNVRYDTSHKFPTYAACEVHRNSDRFKLEQQELTAIVIRPFGEPLPQVTITTKCGKFEPDANGKMQEVEPTAADKAVKDDGSI